MTVSEGTASSPATAPEKTEALFHFLVDSLTEYAVFAVSPRGLFISWNSGAQHTFGYSESEVIGQHFGLLFAPEDIAAGEPQAELADALSGPKQGHDRWHVRKDGSRFWGINTGAAALRRSRLAPGLREKRPRSHRVVLVT